MSDLSDLDYIVVGSGAGGATVARELSVAGKRVLLLEKGTSSLNLRQAKGPAADAPGSPAGRPPTVEVWYAECLGGTTVATMGNAVRSGLGGLDQYFSEAESEMGVVRAPPECMGTGTKALLAASGDWEAMPKAIDFRRCTSCGRCPYGCAAGAKWDATCYIREAASHGCTVAAASGVRRVTFEGGRASGVETLDGRSFRAGSGVILAAGALETPRILSRSGIEGAGRTLFVDTYITVGGVRRGIGFNKELGMALYIRREGYLLSPHYSVLLPACLSGTVPATKPSDILGVMVKIADDPVGEVTPDGLAKGITERDAALLGRGRDEASDLLVEAGADPATIVSTYPRGAHPGGTCVGLDLPESLHLSDASVIPGPFGVPPILSIVALSKRLSAVLLGRA